ncbi:MAG: ABC transporter ATP-binding protein [Rhodobacteraceae bacterium]|nr:ABC transporter ATP-binding protein [Paracoccaceae bacterium]TVR47523.1 MAG: ABC transporter ATP-binding protein [Paracoccaceae bacterium]
MIRIRNVHKRFGTYPAVQEATFDIRRGEFFSILGASGSGKTTLLRILAGFEAASEGEVYIDGAPMDAVPPHQRPVNMVFQNYAIFPHLNVRDNIGFGLRKLRLGKAERLQRINEMLELIKLPGFGDRQADQLSGGQRQRVALARALILRPKVLLLDEPLGALDKQLREQMQMELRALQRSVGITFVLVTHDQEEAMALSDRVAVMAEGRVLQIDTPAGLYDAPKTRRVASFVGSMNFLTGKVLSEDGGMTRIRIADAASCHVPTARLAGMARAPCLAIRPERIAIHDHQPEGQGVPGVLRDRVYMGERTHYHVEIGTDNQPLVVSVPNTAAHCNPQTPGAQVWLSWDDTALVPMTEN